MLGIRLAFFGDCEVGDDSLLQFEN
jgi:hypothetical protein